MSIIIRLQNLPLSAKAADIREFFADLKIPKGAVNIVGGPHGDAFIGFASDEDARLAMRFDGNLLHNSRIRLLLSSRCEMESVISNAHAMAAAALNNNKKSSETLSTENESQRKHIPAGLGTEVSKHSQQVHNISKPVAVQETLFNVQHNNFPPTQQQQSLVNPTVIGESWKSGVYSTNKSLKDNDFSHNAASSISGFGLSVNNNPVVRLYAQKSSKPQTYEQISSHFSVNQQTLYNGTVGTPVSQRSATQSQDSSTSFGVQKPSDRHEQRSHSYQQHFDSPLSISDNYLETRQNFGLYTRSTTQPPPKHLVPSVMDDGNSDINIFGKQNYRQSGETNANGSHTVPNNLRATNIPDQNIFNFNSLGGNKTNNNDICVELSHLSVELFHPANLEKFLAPKIPLTLSSVKFIFDSQGQPQYALVRFGCVEDACNVLARNGEAGIRIRSLSIEDFDFAIDHNVNKNNQKSGIPANKRLLHDDEYHPKRRRDNERSGRSSSNEDNRQSPSDNRPKPKYYILLKNVPFKATHDDVTDYVHSSKANFVKITRIYHEKHDFSDRWIVEVDSLYDKKSLRQYRSTLFRRHIDVEVISAENAEELYSIKPHTKNTEPNLPPFHNDTEVNFNNADKDQQSKVLKQLQQLQYEQSISDQNAPAFPVPQSYTQSFTLPQPLLQRGHRYNQYMDDGRNFNNAYSKSDFNDPPPKITLEASTEDEMITRGELPPTAFGAFSSTSGVATERYFRRNGGTATVREFSYKAPPPKTYFGESDNYPPKSNQDNYDDVPVRKRQRQRVLLPHPQDKHYAMDGSISSRETRRHMNDNCDADYNSRPVSLMSLTFQNEPGPYVENSWKSGKRSSRPPLYNSGRNKSNNRYKSRQNDRYEDLPELKTNYDRGYDKDDNNDHWSKQLEFERDKYKIQQLIKALEAPNKSFTNEQKQIFPILWFVERVGNNGESSQICSAVRLDNAPPYVSAEDLSHFLNVHLKAASEDVVRIQRCNSLYVNLESEELASCAVQNNGNLLRQQTVNITQVTLAEMCDVVISDHLLPQLRDMLDSLNEQKDLDSESRKNEQLGDNSDNHLPQLIDTAHNCDDEIPLTICTNSSN